MQCSEACLCLLLLLICDATQLEFNKDGDQTTTPFQAELKALCEGLVSNANLTTPGQTCDDIDIGKDIKKYG